MAEQAALLLMPQSTRGPTKMLLNMAFCSNNGTKIRILEATEQFHIQKFSRIIWNKNLLNNTF